MPRTPVPDPVENPFLPSVTARGSHFADREAEVARIVDAYSTPGARLVIYGERRMGKTSALERAAEEARERGTPVAIATLASASDPTDAAASILNAVRQQIGRDWREELEAMVGRLQGSVEVRPGPVGMPPSVRISLGLRDTAGRAEMITEALSSVNAQMESRGRRLAIALDEFQRIHEWGGEDAEWALKAAMETHHAVSYVFAGSKRHLIEAMITRKGRALWKQVDSMEFGAIEADELAAWLHHRAVQTGVRLSLEACDEIVRLAGPRTRDIVQLARETWFQGRRMETVGADDVARALDQWVRVESAIYAAIWRERSPVEQRILRALALEPGLALTGADALQRHRLGPKSTVQQSAARLVHDEHLIVRPEGDYAFDDPFLRRWVELYVLPDLGIQPGPPSGAR